MVDRFLDAVIDDVGLKTNRLTIVKNGDGFFNKEEVRDALRRRGVDVISGSPLELRIHFELYYEHQNERFFVYLVNDRMDLLEDIQMAGNYRDFQLATLFPEYYADSIQKCSLIELCLLFTPKPKTTLTESQTNEYIRIIQTKVGLSEEKQRNELIAYFRNTSDEVDFNWENEIKTWSKKLLKAIEWRLWNDVSPFVEKMNNGFQSHLTASYNAHILPSSYAKRPSVVSNVLPYIDFNFDAHQKVALMVIDGMTYWQFMMLSEQMGDQYQLNGDTIYSWIPSITQLSRQAIFRGSVPDSNYIQNPNNEANLWKSFWRSKKIPDAQILYSYNALPATGLEQINRLAYVDVALDDKMHASTDYDDLFDLTRNWIQNSEVLPTIQRLVNEDFNVFITTDHGNIQSKGLNSISQKEKLGTNQSGSRSLRHLEYSDSWLKDNFLKAHADWEPVLNSYGSSLVLNNDSAFCTDAKLVTHGGCHFLEVLIGYNGLC